MGDWNSSIRKIINIWVTKRIPLKVYKKDENWFHDIL